jgi:hypothetical protein
MRTSLKWKVAEGPTQEDLSAYSVHKSVEVVLLLGSRSKSNTHVDKTQPTLCIGFCLYF